MINIMLSTLLVLVEALTAGAVGALQQRRDADLARISINNNNSNSSNNNIQIHINSNNNIDNTNNTILIILIAGRPWLRTNGVNTNGAAAKVMSFDRLGNKR